MFIIGKEARDVDNCPFIDRWWNRGNDRDRWCDATDRKGFRSLLRLTRIGHWIRTVAEVLGIGPSCRGCPDRDGGRG